ncbi:MAG: hypothetical protein AAF761_05130 [Pseudomonadota bacterium]
MTAAVFCATILVAPAHAEGNQPQNLSDCNRRTHISHGGQDGTRDYGSGMVGWVAWWAQEGTFKEVWLANCQSGQALSVRTAEERISNRYIPDRTLRARAALATWADTGPGFFTVDWMAQQLGTFGKDLTVRALGEEVCACAVAYPDLRGTKTPFAGLE